MGAYPRENDVFGRYRIVRRIGRGGMSAVFEARQIDFDRSVALKVLAPDLSEEPEFRARFAREASMLAALESPHVIQVYAHGEHAEQLFIAMQLVRGRDLARLIDESGPMRPVDALDLVSQAAMGLADAHRAGLLHRDVKPANILVRETEGDVFAYLCDFGIAQGAGQHTRTNGVMGTAGYMAPERHEGADASVATDIYSLGCVLWAALTGQPPYGRTSDVQVALAHMQAPVPVFEGETPARDQLNEILQRSMAKDPAHRFASVTEMRRALVGAHLTAQGLRSHAADETQVRQNVAAAPAVGTALRPQPAAHPSVEVTRRRSGRWRGLVLVAAATVVVAGTAAGGIRLLSKSEATENDSAKTAAAPLKATPTAKPSVRATPKKPRPKVKASTSPASHAVAPTTAPTPVSETPTAAPVAVVPTPSKRCWDGKAVYDAADCSTPVGRTGMHAVFPSLDDSCESVTPGVPGKVEVFTCYYRDFLVRYSRWEPSADRAAYLDEANYRPLKDPWSVDFEIAGGEWWSEDHSAGQARPYQWSATYDDSPFEVSVEGTSLGARRAGIDFVDATPPSRLGLAP